MPYEHDHRLVSGLDYYTRTTFEFVSDDLGAQNALLGGGRYDGLSEAIGGPKAPGIGFAMGEDRLVLTLQAQARHTPQLAAAYIAPLGDRMNSAALVMARELRATAYGLSWAMDRFDSEIVRGGKQSRERHRDSRRGRGGLRYLDGKALCLR